MVSAKDDIFKYHMLDCVMGDNWTASLLGRLISSSQTLLPKKTARQFPYNHTLYLAGNATSFEQTKFIFSIDEDDGTGGG